LISASKTTFSHCNLKILRPKITKKILQICLKRFVNSDPETYLTSKAIIITSRKTTYSESVKHPFQLLLTTDSHTLVISYSCSLSLSLSLTHTHTQTHTHAHAHGRTRAHANTRTFGIKSCAHKRFSRHARVPMCFSYRDMKKHRTGPNLIKSLGAYLGA